MATYFKGSKDYIGQNLNEKWTDMTTNKNFVEAISSIGGGGGGNVIEDIQYASLYDKVINETLTPGTWYRITDYKSVNFLNTSSMAEQNPTPVYPSFNPREVYVGGNEVLLFQAVSKNQLSNIGYSESFKDDIIEYDPYVNKIGYYFGFSNGTTMPDASVISGFELQWDGTNVYFNMPAGYPMYYGQALYLYAEFDGGNYSTDGYFAVLKPNEYCTIPYSSDNPDYNYPKVPSRIKLENGGSKVILTDLTFSDFQLYEANTLYVDHIIAVDNAFGWVKRRTDVINRISVPFDFRHRVYRRYEVQLGAFNFNVGTGYYSIGDKFNEPIFFQTIISTGNFRDYFSLDWKNAEVNNFIIEGLSVASDFDFQSSASKASQICENVFIGYFTNVYIDAKVNNNTIGQYIMFTSTDSFNVNIIGGYFERNVISHGLSNFNINSSINVSNNLIGINQNNTFTLSIMSNNTLGTVQNNNITALTNFSNNKFITSILGYNTISVNNFSGNTVDIGFSYNNITAANFSNNTLSCEFIENTVDCLEFVNNNFSAVAGTKFRHNHVKTRIALTGFASSTHVYGDYDCELFKRSNGSLQLSYVDGSNVVQYTAVNA